MRNALAISCSLAVASCFAPVLERQCERDQDCGSGWRCIAASCTPGDLGPDGGAGSRGGGSGGGAAGGASGGGTAGARGGGIGGGGTAGGVTSVCDPTTCLNGCCAGNV